MDTHSKLNLHLEYIVWPESRYLNAAQVLALCNQATAEQRIAAYRRALIRNPLILADEIPEANKWIWGSIEPSDLERDGSQ